MCIGEDMSSIGEDMCMHACLVLCAPGVKLLTRGKSCVEIAEEVLHRIPSQRPAIKCLRLERSQEEVLKGRRKRREEATEEATGGGMNRLEHQQVPPCEQIGAPRHDRLEHQQVAP